MQAAAFVLVGGSSSRMGRDKALLSWNSRPLVDDVARAAAVAGSVALVGETTRYKQFGFDCLPDLRSGCGPLGGIEAALESRRGDLNLILACDMPGLEHAWLSRLLSHAQETGALCVASRDPGGIHPLCAVYRSECLPAIRRNLDARRLRLLDLLRELGATTLERTRPLWNVNTPHDWASCQVREKSLSSADAH